MVQLMLHSRDFLVSWSVEVVTTLSEYQRRRFFHARDSGLQGGSLTCLIATMFFVTSLYATVH